MNLKELKTNYNKYRRRYFMERTIIDPQRQKVPPLASKLTWSFLPKGSPYLAVTHFDEDGDPYALEVNPDLLTYPMGHESRRVLLHELTHMRLGPKVKCVDEMQKRPLSPWREETVRIAVLGAELL